MTNECGARGLGGGSKLRRRRFLTHATQQGTSHHYSRHPDGTMTYSASNFRYIWPAECDLMAQLAGMTLERRLGRLERRPIHGQQRQPCLGMAQVRLTGLRPRPAYP